MQKHLRLKICNSVLRWLVPLLILLLLIQPAAGFFPELNDPRWDPAPKLLKESGWVTEVSETVTVNGVELTLDWFYADELRVGFGFHLKGSVIVKNARLLYLQILLKDAQGQDIQFSAPDGSITFEEDGSINGYAMGSLTPEFQTPVSPFKLELTLNPSRGDWRNLFVLETYGVRKEAPMDDASANILGDQTFEPMMFSLEAPVIPLEIYKFTTETSLNGITVRLLEVKSTPSMTFLTLCYRHDEDQFWSLVGDYLNENPYLVVGEREAFLKSWNEVSNPLRSLSLQSAGDIGINDHEFCGEFGFYLGRTAPAQHFQLEIPVMQRQTTAGEFLDRLISYQANTVDPEFVFYYSWQTEGKSSERVFDLTQYPETLTVDEAYEAFFKQIGVVLEGPWVLEFDLE